MTDEAMIRVIAEFNGLKVEPPFNAFNSQMVSVNGIVFGNYLTSLDAICAVMNKLDHELSCQYLDTLHEGLSEWEFVHATARQRAEALVRTLGKWEDSK